MKAKGEARWTYEELRSIYEQRKSKSRTYANGNIAVRLEKLVRGDGKSLNLRNTKIYLQGENLVARYYETDIVTFHPDGWAEINLRGFTTSTTFDRIYGLAGVHISESGKSCISGNKLRVHTTEVREGEARWWFRRSVPFTEGMRVHLASREIHPDDVAHIPSDRREKYSSPSKAASKAFKPLWAELKTRIMFEVSMCTWAEQLVAGEYPGRVLLKEVARKMADQEVSTSDLFGVLFYSSGKKMWRPTIEGYQKILTAAVPTLRKKLLLEYAREHDQMDTKGGQVLMNGWYVKEGD